MSRPNTCSFMPPVCHGPRFAVAPSSRVIHTPGVLAISFTPFLISHLDSRAPHISFCLLPNPLSSHSPRLGVSALRQMVRRMPSSVPDSLRISFQFGRSSDASATAEWLARQLPHRYDKVRNTLIHQTLLGAGRSPKLLVLVSLTIGSAQWYHRPCQSLSL